MAGAIPQRKKKAPKKRKRIKLKKKELPGSRFMNLSHLIPRTYLSRAGKVRDKKHRRKDRNRKYKRVSDL